MYILIKEKLLRFFNLIIVLVPRQSVCSLENVYLYLLPFLQGRMDNKDNLMVAMIHFLIITPCAINNQNLWRPVGQSSLLDLGKKQ